MSVHSAVIDRLIAVVLLLVLLAPELAEVECRPTTIAVGWVHPSRQTVWF